MVNTGELLIHEWIMTFHILGISSSQLTIYTYIYIYIYHIFQGGRLKPPTRFMI